MKLSLDEIKNILPHRDPILMIDEVICLDVKNKSIVSSKNISKRSSYIDGHYPNYPILPGVLILEGMAQSAGVIIMKDCRNKIPFLVSIEKAKFKKQVVPNVNIVFKVNIISSKKNFFKACGKAFVNEEIVSECSFIFYLEDKKV